MHQAMQSVDVLVIGGGPAGSTAATLLARKGWQVALIEKDRHPRFHIGESLLPMNMPILERLGVLEKMHAIGVRKIGADFPSPTSRGYSVFRFDRSLNPTWPYSFQVRRDQFDQMLFEHAAGHGVQTVQGTSVTGLELDPEGATAELTDAESGATRRLRARYVLDATGRDTFLGKRLGLKRKHTKHQSAALFAHFRGIERRPGEDAGNISVYRFEHGWIWMIPLPDDIMSVGAVCFPTYLKQRRTSNDRFLLDTLRSIPAAWRRMQNPEIVGNLHVTGNYSYVCRRMSGPRWLMIGDAYAFLDPIFSTGVFLAMNSAELAADAVDGVLRGANERALQRRYARTIRQGIDALSWFIYRFNSPAMAYLFANPRNSLRMEEAMISLLAGDVFRDDGVRWRLRAFKTLYYATALVKWRAALASAKHRRAQVGVSFGGGTTGQDHA